MNALSATHQKAISGVEAYLTDFFEQSIANSEAIDPSYARLWQNIRGVTMAGGKRLRPYLVLLSYSLNENGGDIVPVATAYELLQA